MIDCSIYAIAHKPHEFHPDGLYSVLCVGGYSETGSLSEKYGENISGYNDRINECTGLYWIWKNTSSEYVGLCHYRRWLHNHRTDGDQTRLDAERIEEILSDHDIITTYPAVLETSVEWNLVPTLGVDLTEKAFAVFCTEILDKQPEYFNEFFNVMTGNRFYPHNLFVTRREILNRYCEWLFSFLTEAADRIDVSGYEGKQKRIAGYFAEIMPAVWLARQELKVYSLPNQMAYS